MAGYDKKRRHERYIKNKERENAQSKAYKELPVDGGSMKNFVEVDEDFEVMMICAIRYGLWRRTYITILTSDYLIPLVNKGLFSRKTLTVMDEDLTRYENDRADRLADGAENKWALDDDCDFEAWRALHAAIQTKLKEEA